MFRPRCPKCRSKRIRHGYKPTPFILRTIGIYNLLCDNCNLLFTKWIVPGTVRKHGSAGKRKSKPPQQKHEAHKSKGRDFEQVSP
ncbi:MAG: hypothetical protein WBP93_07385 [Pyrinomonadaceae bacterium]